MNNIEKLEIRKVPEDEIDISFGRSSGPGGQNVNTRDTKAILRWKVEDSAVFIDEEKEKIKEVLANRINKEGVLMIEAQKERTQLRNKEIVLGRINELVEDALTSEAKRIPTKPTKASKEKRIRNKIITKKKKASRQRPDASDWN